MIRTLRITSIIAAILAVVTLILPIVYGVKPSPDVEQILSEPGAVEQFKESRGQTTSAPDARTSPLVKQAEAFALYLNPPPPPKPQAPVTVQSPVKALAEPLAQVTPKFDLIGTSIHTTRPELSLALIDEPGKGLHWVRPGEAIDRFTLAEIRPSSVTLRDGEKTLELTVVAKSQPAPAAGTPASPTPAPHSPSQPVRPATSAAARVRGRTPPAATAATPPPTQPTMALPQQPVTPPSVSSEQEAALSRTLAELEKLSQSADPTARTAGGLTRDELMDKLLADLQAAQMSPSEAQRLGELGKELQAARTEPNAPAPPPAPTEPNKPSQ